MKKSIFLKIMLTIAIMAVIFAGCSKDGSENEQPVVENPSEEAANPEDDKSKDESSDYGIKINEENVVFTDESGKEVTITKNPQRVVVLQNSLLEIWDQAGGKVVGRVEESEDKIVENAMSAEVVGSMGAPSLEKILSLQPDLIIISGSYSAQREMVPSFEQNKIQVINLDNDILEDYYKTVRMFTAITGREDLYENHVSNIQKKVDEIIAKAPKDKNYKAVIIFATAKNTTVRDSNTMVGEMIKDLNVINISDSVDAGADTKTFSIERILQEDPDFIFVQTMGSDLEKITERLKSDALDNPAWASLTAVKEDRYIVLPKDLYLYKPNDRYPEAYEGLAKMIYPEVFSE
ncbi:ABC transporter substrate-binding protein [Sedimentibacter hydroxybenzoicus DSM 7310]|uniref:ABC transporter substrate-binding protein n=1 Tax=Sedimentibacter hydroxybenzoicus DSM 7310 TaxID=1123245 RepID=A0A974GX13_SEDHY|nr:ABC transporter substrate-binding protein [Sedimentibacter hydroxybenzoicus]NYB75038.1 ABC transporter substrate-binding protein [Sedimentibacter hydroxybenzoicus DSM 7310]